ncbi:MAG: sugar O-acetyltransferase [Cyanobacteria bacterium P01_E01_bin.6]
MVTEKEKMLIGELYDPTDPQLTAERQRARMLCQSLNASSNAEDELRQRIFQDLFRSLGNDFWLEPPFYCDYGSNITIGDRVFFNFNCVVLDPAPVTIGHNVFIGPSVQLYTAMHPLDASERRTWKEYAKPISIGSDVWIGGGAIVCPGVRIGNQSVIGAGSVVTRDIPSHVLAVGNPCRIIRSIVDHQDVSSATSQQTDHS